MQKNREHKVMITNMKLISQTQQKGKQQELQLMNLRMNNDGHGKENSSQFVIFLQKIKMLSARHDRWGM